MIRTIENGRLAGSTSTIETPAVRLRFAGKKPTQAEGDTVSLSSGLKRGNLLANTDQERDFAGHLEDLFKPFSNETYAMTLDEQKRPPMEVLKALVDDGTYVIGVPVPAKQTAQSLMDDTGFSRLLQDVLPQDVYANLRQWYQAPTRDNGKLKSLGKSGYAKLQTLSAIEMARKIGVGVSTFLGVNAGLAAEAIAKIGTPEQQALFLNAINDGVITTAFGLTEEKVGSDIRNMETTFEPVEVNGKRYYKLNGNKKFIGNAAQVVDPETGKVIHRGADFIVVFAVDDASKPPEEREFAAFLVPRSLIGEANIRHTGGDSNKMGLREVNNGDFDLKDVLVPEELLLGTPGENIYPKQLRLLDETRLFVGAMSVGAAEGVLDLASGFAEQRLVRGKPIRTLQGVSMPLQKLYARLEAARLLALNAADRIDYAAGLSAEKQTKFYFRTDTSMSKLFASELAVDAADQAKQTLGGRGYLRNEEGLGVEKRLRDIAVLPIYEGTSNIQRGLISQGVMIDEGKKLGSLPQPVQLARLVARRAINKKELQASAFSPFTPSPMRIINSVYDYAFADTSIRYGKAYTKIAKAVSKVGPNASEAEKAQALNELDLADGFFGWDKESRKRDQQMAAFNAVQRRMYYLADIATTRQAATLATAELERLDAKAKESGLSAEEKFQKEALDLYLNMAREEAQRIFMELNGEVLKNLERQHRL